MNKLLDANLIYEAGTKAMASSKWKEKTQDFEIHHLLETAKIQQSLADGTYKANKGDTFTINERGKTRIVTSIPTRDKTVNHLLCDEILTPVLNPHLIHDNGASQTGKGVKFHRRRFEQHIHEYYSKHGNDGYILLGDFKSYYGSIDPIKARQFAMKYIRESHLLDSEKRMTDWLLHEALGDELGINIGGQPSQNIGILYATPLDQYVKTVRGFHHYARYSDDFYCIDQSRERLTDLSKELQVKAKEYGLKIHPNKTHIARLSETFTHLQVKYKLDDSGTLIKRIKSETVTRERNRLKAYRHLLDEGRLTMADIENDFKSWMYQNYQIMSLLQIKGIYELYLELFGKEITWKKSRLRYLTEQSLSVGSTAITTYQTQLSPRAILKES